MFCVILAAGKGTRMGNLTKDTQKAMLEIKGKPKLAYTVENLPEEITDVVFIVGYKKEQIRDYFREEYQGLKIHYIKQKELNGTGGAILLAKDIVKGKFLAMYGDDLYRKKDLERVIKHDCAMLTYYTENAESFGITEDDGEGFAKSVIEKPHGEKVGVVNAGVFVLPEEYFDYEPVYFSETEAGLPQTLMSMYPKYKAKIIKTIHWQPFGDPQQLKEAEKRIDDFVDKKEKVNNVLEQNRVYVFIDAGNLWDVYKAKKYLLDFKKLKKYFEQKYIPNILEIFYYTAYPKQSTRKYDVNIYHSFFTFLKKGLSFKVIKKPLKQIKVFEKNILSITEKGNMDVEISIDVVKNIDNFDTMVLFSGDSDFLELVNFAKNKNKKVFIYSSKNSISIELRKAGNKYVDLLEVEDDIWGNEIKNKEKEK